MLALKQRSHFMAVARDHFSIGQEISPQTSPCASSSVPATAEEQSLDAPTAPHRICLRISALHAEHSPSHHAISFSSWTRYNTTPTVIPLGQLKASDLWKANGTSSSYDPPVSEWVYLGADQPVHMDVKPAMREKWNDWRNRRSPGGSPLSNSAVLGESGLDFRKQPLKRSNTASALTNALKMGSRAMEKVTAAKKYGLEGLTCDDLPSAFDSDSDDED